MFNLGMGEITIILMLALIFLGPKKLPELASGLGKLIREIRKTTSDVKNEIQLDDAIRKPFEELREAVTLHPDELKRRDKLRKELADIQRQAEEAVAAAEANMSQSPPEAPTEAEGGGHTEIGSGPSFDSESAGEYSAAGPGSDGGGSSAPADESLSAVTPPPVVAGGPVGPGVPGAAPVGTVARTPSGRVGASSASVPAPPAPPLAAVLAKGAPSPTERRGGAAQPPGGSDFLRSLRAVPEGHRPEGNRPEGKSDASRTPGRRTLPGNADRFGPDANSAADRGNITQALTEADLAAITVGPPPPPPAPARSPLPAPPPSAAEPQPTPPRLPGATPPKKKSSNQ